MKEIAPEWLDMAKAISAARDKNQASKLVYMHFLGLRWLYELGGALYEKHHRYLTADRGVHGDKRKLRANPRVDEEINNNIVFTEDAEGNKTIEISGIAKGVASAEASARATNQKTDWIMLGLLALIGWQSLKPIIRKVVPALKGYV